MSTVGNARITLLFGLNRDIDGAARDVQAAINAARADLPTSLRSNPTYRKVNPADAPILILALTSKTKTQPQLYDSAATVLEQKLSQVEGIGQVQIGGSSLPAVRVELQPGPLFRYGIGLEDVRAAIAAANANSPKGAIELGGRRYQVYTNDQARRAARVPRPADRLPQRGGGAALGRGPGRGLGREPRNLGLANGSPSVLCILYRQPGANIIATVERVKALVPELEASIPRDIDLTLAADRSSTIRASLRETELTLAVAMALVVGVVFLFLRSGRATLIPAVAVPVSIVGTFSAMYLLGYSIDNLSLMALTIATGFVVDDAIVVLENIARHVEAGQSRLAAALEGAREVGFTVLSMSLSLVAVFLPILLMGGLLGRIFREFAVTLSLAIVVSLVVSLTTTPMMCRYLLAPPRERGAGPAGALDRTGAGRDAARVRALAGLDAPAPGAGPALAARDGGAQRLPVHGRAEGPLPDQDTGRLIGGIQADQSISFALMKEKLAQLMAIVRSDPTVESVVGFTGGGADQLGLHVRLAQALRRAGRHRRAGGRPAAAAAGRGAGRSALPVGGAGLPHGRPADQRELPVHAHGRFHRRALRVGPQAGGGPRRRAAARGRQLRPAAERAGDASSPSTARRRRASASAPPRSTTRSTTPSASGRSRRSTTR